MSEWDSDEKDEDEIPNPLSLQSASSRAPSASIIAQISSPPKWLTSKRTSIPTIRPLNVKKGNPSNGTKKGSLSHDLSLSSDDEPSLLELNVIESHIVPTIDLVSADETLERPLYDVLPLQPSDNLQAVNPLEIIGKAPKRPSLTSLKLRDRRIEAKRNRNTELLTSMVVHRTHVAKLLVLERKESDNGVRRQLKLDGWLKRERVSNVVQSPENGIMAKKNFGVKVEVLNMGLKLEDKSLMRRYGEAEENWTFPASIQKFCFGHSNAVDDMDRAALELKGAGIIECGKVGNTEWEFISLVGPYAAVLINPNWQSQDPGCLLHILKTLMKGEIVMEGGIVSIFVESEEIASTVKLCDSVGLEYADNVTCVMKNVENEFVEMRQMAGGAYRRSKISMLMFRKRDLSKNVPKGEHNEVVALKHQRSADVVFYIRKSWFEFGNFSRPFDEIYPLIETLVSKKHSTSSLDTIGFQYLELWSRPASMIHSFYSQDVHLHSSLFSSVESLDKTCKDSDHYREYGIGPSEDPGMRIFNFGRNRWLMVHMKDG